MNHAAQLLESITSGASPIGQPTYKHTNKPTVKEAGYSVAQDEEADEEGGRVLLSDKEGKLEVWEKRTGPVSGYCLRYGDWYLEFARDYYGESANAAALVDRLLEMTT